MSIPSPPHVSQNPFGMISYQLIISLEVQMIIVVILVLDHDIVLHECGQDSLLPSWHLW